MEAREAFLHAGGERFDYIPCLNDHPDWIRGMTELVERHLQGWPTKVADNPMELQASRERALALGGSSLRDFTSAQGQSGYFQLDAMVYGRDGLPCRVCDTPIKSIRQGQRSTFFCTHCQKP